MLDYTYLYPGVRESLDRFRDVLPAVGPLPTIDEPVWLLSKGICALAEVTVISLWLVRAIAPASPPH